MDDQKKAAKHEEALREDINAYRKLQNLSNSEDADQIFNLLLTTATRKIITAFTTDEIKNWEDFCKLRGEVFACLYPVQEVRGAQAIADKLQSTLDGFYPKQ